MGMKLHELLKALSVKNPTPKVVQPMKPMVDIAAQSSIAPKPSTEPDKIDRMSMLQRIINHYKSQG